MSRQRAGYGLTRFLQQIRRESLPKSTTAGKNKYEPDKCEQTGAAKRRLAALKRRADKVRAEREV